MKIAYLILCHKEPEQINMLLQELIADGSDCYIHIDKKSSMSKDQLISSEHILFVPDERRVDIRWAANTMVRATLELLEVLIKGKRLYDYVCLLSGQDFPIKSSQYRSSFLQKNKGYNFIEVLSHEEYKYKRYDKRSLLYFPSFVYKSTFLAKAIRKLIILSTGGYTKTLSLFVRKNKSGVKFEYGSQWWCLTYECVLWMMDYIKNRVNVDYFDHALTPDECFFQSVFMMSPFNGLRKDRIMYLEWAENENNPRILRSEDYEMLVSCTDKLFARKFDIRVDQSIFEKLKETGK